LKSLKHHPGFNCGFEFNEIISEKKIGFNSAFTLKCKFCGNINILYSDNPNTTHTNVTTAAASGASYSCLDELSTALDIPPISKKTFFRHQNKVYEAFYSIAFEQLEIAGKEEARLAIEAGMVNEQGIPIITVLADGAWSKRSYKTNYNALSGVACIIGYRTKKILFIGVKNKYCCICDRDQRLGSEKTEHVCFKNWSSTSTSMESNIIVEGFKKSLDMHKLTYGKIIGDGDSSVIRRIREAAPYGPQFIVQKIECKNHILRNFMNKVKELGKTPKLDKKLRNFLASNHLRFRTAVTKAIEFRSNQDVPKNNKISLLRKDITNGHKHIFGEHSDCDLYFCSGAKENETNNYDLLKSSPIYETFLSLTSKLGLNAHSLIENVDTNIVETFNAIVAKFVSGKRINYSQRSSYTARSIGAAASFNLKGYLHVQLQKQISSDGPSTFVQNHCKRKFKKLTSCSKKKKVRRNTTQVEDADYGEEANVPFIPDISTSEYEEKKKIFFNELEQDNPEEICK
jgi:hypothetical protein